MSRRQHLEGIEHVVWDWNGTLLDDRDHCVRVINGLLREQGLPEIDVERYLAVFDFPVRVYYERLGFDLSEERWEELAQRFIRAYDAGSTDCPLQHGAADVLAALTGSGKNSSILSAARAASIEPLLAHHGISEHFSTVAGQDDHYATGKLERGLTWLTESGLDPGKLLLVGDTLHDHEVGRALGVRVVLVATGHQSKDRLRAARVPVVDRLEELFG